MEKYEHHSNSLTDAFLSAFFRGNSLFFTSYPDVAQTPLIRLFEKSAQEL
jgi:hypothetical protein